MKERNKLIVFIIIIFLFASVPVKAKASIGVSAYSSILIEQESGRVLFEKNAHERQRIASITKIMTAIIAIELGDLQEIIKIKESATNIEGSSIYLQKNDKISLEDLLYGLMLRSGNDAAVAIAEHIGGSLDSFVYLMNEKAKELGMKNTAFANPHGLDDHEEHFSTPYDMALLMRYAMLDESFRKISNTKKYKNWTNKNRLLTEKYKYCTGGKTGFTKRAKRTLVTSASRDDLNLIAVTLNGPNDWEDHENLYEYGFKTYKMTKILNKGEVKTIPSSIYGKKISLKRNYYYPLKKGEEKGFKIHYKIVDPAEKDIKEQQGTIVGKVEVHFNDNIVSELPLYYNVEHKEKGKFRNFLKKAFTSFIGVSYDG